MRRDGSDTSTNGQPSSVPGGGEYTRRRAQERTQPPPPQAANGPFQSFLASWGHNYTRDMMGNGTIGDQAGYPPISPGTDIEPASQTYEPTTRYSDHSPIAPHKEMRQFQKAYRDFTGHRLPALRRIEKQLADPEIQAKAEEMYTRMEQGARKTQNTTFDEFWKHYSEFKVRKTLEELQDPKRARAPQTSSATEFWQCYKQFKIQKELEELQAQRARAMQDRTNPRNGRRSW